MFEELLRGSMELKENEFDNREQAKKVLQNYLKSKIDFEVGDYVELKDEYSQFVFPKDNQVAICSNILTEPLVTDSDEIYDAEITVAINKKLVKKFMVDGKKYKKSIERKNVTKLPWKK